MARKIIAFFLALLFFAVALYPSRESQEISAVRYQVLNDEATQAPIETVEPKLPEETIPPIEEPTPAPAPEAQNDGQGLVWFDAITTVDPNLAAPTVSPTPAPIRYNALYEGINDGEGENDVKLCQKRLKELGYLDVPADGGYGEVTAKAVRVFQSLNGLPETGIADNETLTRLYSDTAIKNSNDTSSGTIKSLKLKDSGDQVVKLQNKLIEYGFMGGKADGIYGSVTEEGVKMLQKYYNELDSQSVTTEETAQQDNSGYRPAPTPGAFTADGKCSVNLYNRFMRDETIPIYTKDLKAGDNNMEVMRMQNRLITLGYMRAHDGDFGNITVPAVKYFQRLNGFEETGIADEETIVRLYSSVAVISEELVMPYKIFVDIDKQQVTIYGWDGGAYTHCIKTMKCSTGRKATPTPTGTFTDTGPLERWHYFTAFHSYAQYAWLVYRDEEIFFHSVLFNDKSGKSSSMQHSTLENLGKPASHGCIRLTVADAKWIYENCPAGVTVVITGEPWR